MKIQPCHPFRSPERKEAYLAYYDSKEQQWPVAYDTQIIDTAYGKTFVRISGPGGSSEPGRFVDAPNLVLLPGASSSSLMWQSSIKALSRNYKVYAVDNIYDFGRSVFNRGMNHSKDFVAWLDELFTTLDLGNQVNLMGMSFGAWLTAQYALNCPKRLNKMVMLAPPATVLPIRWKFMCRILLFAIPYRPFVKSTMYWLLKDMINKGTAYRTIVDEYIDEVMFSRRCFKFKAPVNPRVLSDRELSSIQTPGLFLVGENEKLYVASKALARLNAVAPQIRGEIILDAGHDLLFVQNELVIKTILEFLR